MTFFSRRPDMGTFRQPGYAATVYLNKQTGTRGFQLAGLVAGTAIKLSHFRGPKDELLVASLPAVSFGYRGDLGSGNGEYKCCFFCSFPVFLFLFLFSLCCCFPFFCFILFF